MRGERLHVWADGNHVGEFIRTSGGRVSFHYDSKEGAPISLSLPRTGKASGKTASAFLENLLPDDENARRRMALRLHLDSTDMFTPPEPPMRVRLHEAGHAVVGHRFGYTQQGIMLREDDTGETSQQYATGMDDDMSVRLQTETIISMAGFAVTLEYPEYRTDALRIGGDVQMELVNAAIIHRIDPAMGSTDEIMDSLWVRARLAARNNKPLIQAVAARLDHYGFWTGEDVQRIIDEYEKELDH